jgi:hypothetical protein
MSLRAKLLALFAGFGVLPIVALGVYGYFRSVQSVEQLIRERTSAIAEDIAGEIQSRYALRQSDLLLFADNAETQRLYEAHAAGDPARYASALDSADAYLREAWSVLGSSYTAIAFRDSQGNQLYGLGDQRAGGVNEATIGLIDRGVLFPLVQPVRDARSGSETGMMEVTVRLQALLPREVLSAAFGERGYSVVLDRAGSEVLHHPRATFMRQPMSDLLGPTRTPQPQPCDGSPGHASTSAPSSCCPTT